MKLLFLLPFFWGTQLLAQSLKNTEWTQIKIERKDGSRIIDHLSTAESITKYQFKNETVSIIVDNAFVEELVYQVTDKTLTIGKSSKYNIEKADSDILVISQLSKDVQDDRLNRLVFINRLSLFEYLNENKQIEIIGDSLIVCSRQFAPSYYGNISEMILDKFLDHNETKTILGSLIIASKGNIERVQFETNNKFSQKETNKFSAILNQTSGSWLVPTTPKPYKFKLNFEIEFSVISPLSGVTFSLLSTSPAPPTASSRSLKQVKEADAFFNKGNDFISKKKYDKARDEYLKCIEIDPIYLDAYYNLAYCYTQQGKKESACEIWQKLKLMGQKQGEYLFDEQCK